MDLAMLGVVIPDAVLDMPITGVIVEGQPGPLNPYTSPDTQVARFDPTCYLITNALHHGDITSEVGPGSSPESRLGVRQTGQRTITIPIHLETQRGGRHTMASSDRIDLSLTHEDDRDDEARSGLFCRIYENYGFLHFHELYRRAGMGPEGHDGVHILGILHDLATAVPHGNRLTSFVIARESIESVFRSIETALYPGPITPESPRSLYQAWQDFIEDIRRPYFRAAGEQLARADEEVERFSADLLRKDAQLHDLKEVHRAAGPTPRR